MGKPIRGVLLRASRRLLLLMLVLGVCGMHTMGHLNPDHAQGMASVTPMHGAPSGSDAMDSRSTPSAAGSSQEGHLTSTSGTGMPGFDPSAVCLAVLASLLVLTVAVTWIRARCVSEGLIGAVASVRRVARPPPKRNALRLARLSVLRI
jgi:hypothetical protein